MGQSPLGKMYAVDAAGVTVPVVADSGGNLLTNPATPVVAHTNYETVAASQTAQVLGGAGAIGDVLERLIITPDTTAAGAVTILDGATSIPVFVGGGTTALISLSPITVTIGAASVTGPWKVTTGANVTVVAVGKFST